MGGITLKKKNETEGLTKLTRSTAMKRRNENPSRSKAASLEVLFKKKTRAFLSVQHGRSAG